LAVDDGNSDWVHRSPQGPEARDKTLTNYFSALSSFYEFLAVDKKISANPVIPIRKRYLKSYKDNNDGQERKLISVEEMGRMINSEMDIRDKAIITLLAKDRHKAKRAYQS
jgi:integrase/recombinase XerD